MNLKHTPRPWRFLEDGDTECEGNAGRPLTIASDDDDLAEVFSSDDATVKTSREQAIANARLIAHAPDLLFIVRRLERAIDMHLGRSAWTQTQHLKGIAYSVQVREELYAAHDEARRLLTKATGGVL